MEAAAKVGVLHKEDLERSLRRHYEDETLKITNVLVTVPPLKNDNFTTKVDYLDVTFEIGSPRRTESLAVFVKKALLSGPFAKSLTESYVYEKEAMFFNVILPFLRDLCSGSHLHLDFVPVCYYASPQVVAMENLVVSKGFRMHSHSSAGQNVTHVELVLETLAKWHAASFLMKKNWDQPEVTVLDKYPLLRDTLIGDNAETGLGILYTSTFENTRKFLEYNGRFPDTSDIMTRIETRVLDVYKEMIRPKEPFSVICHSDCWNNNMLFLYPSDDKDFQKPTQVMLVDFQVMRWAPLTIDLLYFFFTSTSRDFRQKNLPRLLEFYYEKLSQAVKLLGLQEPPFTFQQLQEDFFRRKLFGLVVGMGILTMSYFPKDSMPGIEIEEFNPDDSTDNNQFIAVFQAAAKALPDNFLATVMAEYIEDFRSEIQDFLERHPK